MIYVKKEKEKENIYILFFKHGFHAQELLFSLDHKHVLHSSRFSRVKESRSYLDLL